ncbi:MAG: SDR family NAD(P)-dependent oxidoreductase [Nitrospinaceae bacterium]
MDMNLEGRKVLITGIGEGIGRTLALDFARSGARVAGCARSENRLSALASEAEGTGHLFLPADLTKRDDIQSLHDRVMEDFGGLDVLVNNVGSIVKMGNFLEISDQDWQDSFNINLMPAVRLSRLFLPTLKHSGAPRIINITSIAGSRPGEMFPHYSAMKAALSNFTVSLAQTLAPDKILVNSVAPGPVWTRSWVLEAQLASQQSGKDLKAMTEEIRSHTADQVLLKRMGMPEDVSGLVLFLASDRACWITGTHFTVDGGVNLNPY